jgi:hypothetical protein
VKVLRYACHQRIGALSIVANQRVEILEGHCKYP